MPDPTPFDLPDAIRAIDRLNRAVRASPRLVHPEVVDTIKDRAIEVLVGMGAATLRRCVYVSPCRVCGGDGWYRKPGEWGDHDDGESCRTCAGAGKKRLRFVETTIPAADVRWHSPADAGAGEALWAMLAHTPIGDTGTWAPQRPGDALSGPEIAEALCDAEAWLAPTWLVLPPALARATLELGDLPGPCEACLAEVDLFNRLHVEGRVSWFGRLCRACTAARIGVPDAELPPPRYRPRELADPRVERWRLAHPVARADQVIVRAEDLPF